MLVVDTLQALIDKKCILGAVITGEPAAPSAAHVDVCPKDASGFGLKILLDENQHIMFFCDAQDGQMVAATTQGVVNGAVYIDPTGTSVFSAMSKIKYVYGPLVSIDTSHASKVSLTYETRDSTLSKGTKAAMSAFTQVLSGTKSASQAFANTKSAAKKALSTGKLNTGDEGITTQVCTIPVASASKLYVMLCANPAEGSPGASMPTQASISAALVSKVGSVTGSAKAATLAATALASATPKLSAGLAKISATTSKSAVLGATQKILLKKAQSALTA